MEGLGTRSRGRCQQDRDQHPIYNMLETYTLELLAYMAPTALKELGILVSTYCSI